MGIIVNTIPLVKSVDLSVCQKQGQPSPVPFPKATTMPAFGIVSRKRHTREISMAILA